MEGEFACPFCVGHRSHSLIHLVRHMAQNCVAGQMDLKCNRDGTWLGRCFCGQTVFLDSGPAPDWRHLFFHWDVEGGLDSHLLHWAMTRGSHEA